MDLGDKENINTKNEISQGNKSKTNKMCVTNKTSAIRSYKQNLLSDKIINIKASATLEINRLIASLRQSGAEIISLTTGEPDQDVPKYIKDAAKLAIEENSNKYTSSMGLLELRHEVSVNINIQIDKYIKMHMDDSTKMHLYDPAKIHISDHVMLNYEEISSVKCNINTSQSFQHHNKISDIAKIYTQEDVIVVSGCKQALFSLFLATINFNDEVIIPSPSWPSYEEMIKLFGGNPVYVNGLLDPTDFINDLKAKITQRTKFIIVNSPNNPTGLIYSMEMLTQIIRLAKKHNLYIIADDIYDFLIYEPYVSIIQLAYEKDFLKNIIVINGPSKKYGVMGWRLGWIASKDHDLISAIQKAQSQTISNVCNIVQKAICSALKHENQNTSEYINYITSLKAEYFLKKQIIEEKFTKLKPYGIDFKNPQGAFYIFLNIKAFLEKYNKTIDEVTKDLLYQQNIAVLSGKPFGSNHHLRISFAKDVLIISKGCEKIIKYFRNFYEE